MRASTSDTSFTSPHYSCLCPRQRARTASFDTAPTLPPLFSAHLTAARSQRHWSHFVSTPPGTLVALLGLFQICRCDLASTLNPGQFKRPQVPPYLLAVYALTRCRRSSHETNRSCRAVFSCCETLDLLPASVSKSK